MKRLLQICAFLVASAVAQPAVCQPFADNFEAPTIDPFWSVFQQLGSVQLSTDQSQSGAQSVKLSAISGGQRNIWLSHTFAQPTKGTLSVWFYDTTPGSPTVYSGLYAFNSVTGHGYAVNVADWSGSNYIWSGAGVGETPTSISRSAGWHHFVLKTTATEYEASIDGIVVGSVAGDFAFDSVYLLMQGPNGPNASFYLDDFLFQPLSQPTVGVCALYDTSKAHRRNSTVPIKIQVCDSDGVNLSSADLTVQAIEVVRVSDQTTGVLEDSGNANPDSNFRYSDDLQGYIFNLSTKGLTAGSYELRLTVAGDSTVHSVPFQVR